MSNVFVWLSGVSPDLLKQCHQAERIRFAGIGALVLVPAALGFLSMSYALSTVTASRSVVVGGGLLWFLIIVTIDRYIVSTMYKSTVTPWWQQTVTVVARYLLAIVVGIAVSHPFVLFYFADSIEARISESEREAVAVLVQEAANRKRQVQPGGSGAALSVAIEHRNCQQQLLTAEQSGILVQLPCGFSSGLKECGSRCANIRSQIRTSDNDIARMSAAVEADRDRELEQIGAIDNALASSIRGLESRTSYDYLARVNALDQIRSRRPHVTVVMWFIIALFLVIDTLPVTMKVATPAGEYEKRRDTLLAEMTASLEADQEANKLHYKSDAYKLVQAVRLAFEAKKAELSGATYTTISFLQQLDAYRDTFEQFSRRMTREIDEIRDVDTRSKYAAFVTKSREVFVDAWYSSVNRFHKYLRDLT